MHKFNFIRGMLPKLIHTITQLILKKISGICDWVSFSYVQDSTFTFRWFLHPSVIHVLHHNSFEDLAHCQHCVTQAICRKLARALIVEDTTNYKQLFHRVSDYLLILKLWFLNLLHLEWFQISFLVRHLCLLFYSRVI